MCRKIKMYCNIFQKKPSIITNYFTFLILFIIIVAKDQVVVCATASPHKFLPIVTSVLGDDALTPHPKLSHLATAANHAIAIDMNDKTQCLSAIRQQITELASFLVNDQ